MPTLSTSPFQNPLQLEKDGTSTLAFLHLFNGTAMNWSSAPTMNDNCEIIITVISQQVQVK